MEALKAREAAHARELELRELRSKRESIGKVWALYADRQANAHFVMSSLRDVAGELDQQIARVMAGGSK
jgi:hypothetical protein